MAQHFLGLHLQHKKKCLKHLTNVITVLYNIGLLYIMVLETIVVIILASIKILELSYKILKKKLFKFRLYFSNSSSSNSSNSS